MNEHSHIRIESPAFASESVHLLELSGREALSQLFEFHAQVDRLHKAGLLYLVTEKFANVDLHPDSVSNAQMGLVFEELIE